MTAPRSLTRPALEDDGTIAPAAPVRIVHLGLGAFHRAHQAWYTARVDSEHEWGIAAFTGRDAAQARLLGGQDGLYTLVERGPEHDRVELVDAIVETRSGDDVTRLLELLAAPSTAIVTLTVTEAGYRLTPERRIDLRDAVVAADLERLAVGVRERTDAALAAAAPQAPLTRLLAGLLARHRGGGAPIAVVPCDNLPDNGRVVARALADLARELPADAVPSFGGWLDSSVSCVGTSIDRITPRTNGEATAAALEAGWIDVAPVVTEPFRDWVLEGDFPLGRPAWEHAGARFVDDITGWEHRKLWLLNGAHTILAVAGLRRGHVTVDEAIADPECLAVVEAFWHDAVELLPDDIEHVEYRRDLLARFRNARIRHELDQIAADTTLKISVRIGAVARRRRASGLAASGCIRALAEWCAWVGAGGLPIDAQAAERDAAASGSDPVHALISIVSPSLGGDAEFVADVRSAVEQATASNEWQSVAKLA